VREARYPKDAQAIEGFHPAVDSIPYRMRGIRPTL
jgi:hypothetical protein